jgi:curved DNA-binding protein
MKFGRLRQRSHLETHQTRRVKSPGFLQQLGQKIGRFLSGGQKTLSHETQEVTVRPQDLTYNLPLPPEDAQRGTWVTIAIDRGQGKERLKVRIPPGTRSGTRLRLTGKGRHHAFENGDLYLTVNVA